MKYKSAILWSIFSVELIIIGVYLLEEILGISFGYSFIIKSLLLVLPIALLVLHAFWTLSFARSLFFVLLAAGIGFLSEVLGLSTGTIFGGRYVYNTNTVTLFNVPWMVIVYWAVFIYTGYSISTSFHYWLRKNKPSKENHNLLLLVPLILLDGYVVTAIDLFMDPLEVYKRAWTWLDKGPYFGIPIGNFIGWFFVTIVVTSIFRFFEYFYPQTKQSISKSVYILPVIAYGVMAFSFAVSAFTIHMNSLAVIGLVFMLPIVLLNITLYSKTFTS